MGLRAQHVTASNRVIEKLPKKKQKSVTSSAQKQKSAPASLPVSPPPAPEMVLCPRCKCSVRAERLAQHAVKAHPPSALPASIPATQSRAKRGKLKNTKPSANFDWEGQEKHGHWW